MKVGGTYRPGGVVSLRVDDVQQVPVSSITDADACTAGEPDRAASCAGSACRRALAPCGASTSTLSTTPIPGRSPAGRRPPRRRRPGRDRAAARHRLDLGRRRTVPGPATLTAIAAHPGVVSTVLAEQLGRDRPAFKIDVRKLKALGLTESLEVATAPRRGRAFLDGSTVRPIDTEGE